MLIEFSVANFLSFKDRVTLSMVASGDDSLPQNVIKSAQGTDLNLLKSAVIYGANASGKSNFVKAMFFMLHFITNTGTKTGKEVTTKRKYFKLDESYSEKPSEFEIDFLHEGIRYIYGFKIDDTSVVEEWYYFYPKGQQVLLFERTSNTGDVVHDYKFGTQFKGGKKSLAENTKNHSLFISVASQFNNKIAQIVVDWFTKYVNGMGIFGMGLEKKLSIEKSINNDNFKNRFLRFIKDGDIGIEDFSISITKMEDNFVNAIKEMIGKIKPGINTDVMELLLREQHSVSTTHKRINKKGTVEFVSFKLEDESDGTQKLFTIAGSWLDALESGSLIIADEFDLHLHPLLAENLIKTFNSGINKENAQLIITTHNTDLLDKNIFRRDQVWFIDKSHKTGASSLFSLWDFKTNKARKTDNLRKNYMMGRYGAIPILSNFD